MKRIRQVYARVPETLAKNHKTFAAPGGTVKGFGAGEAYPQIWLRDSSWIVPAAAAYYDADVLTSWLDLHLAAAQKNGHDFGRRAFQADCGAPNKLFDTTLDTHSAK